MFESDSPYISVILTITILALFIFNKMISSHLPHVVTTTAIRIPFHYYNSHQLHITSTIILLIKTLQTY